MSKWNSFECGYVPINSCWPNHSKVLPSRARKCNRTAGQKWKLEVSSIEPVETILDLIPTVVDIDVEENSGIEFPGESIEPYVGTSLNFDDKEFTNELIVCEVGT